MLSQNIEFMTQLLTQINPTNNAAEEQINIGVPFANVTELEDFNTKLADEQFFLEAVRK